jgi:hypothetical protein
VADSAPADSIDPESDDEMDYDMDAIEDARINTRLVDPATNRKGLLQYLVCDELTFQKPDNPTWEPYMNVDSAADLVMHFHEQHPHKPAARRPSPSPAPPSDNIAVLTPERAQSSPVPTLPSPHTALPAPHVLPSDDGLPSLADDFDDNMDSLLVRTHSGINYTTMRLSQNLPIQQTTRFSIPRRTDDYKPSGTEVAALNLLQARSSPAIIAYQGPCYMVSELGMPNIFVVSEGGAQLVSTAQWWVGKSAAEIKTGPHVDEDEVRKRLRLCRAWRPRGKRESQRRRRKRRSSTS